MNDERTTRVAAVVAGVALVGGLVIGTAIGYRNAPDASEEVTEVCAQALLDATTIITAQHVGIEAIAAGETNAAARAGAQAADRLPAYIEAGQECAELLGAE